MWFLQKQTNGMIFRLIRWQKLKLEKRTDFQVVRDGNGLFHPFNTVPQSATEDYRRGRVAELDIDLENQSRDSRSNR
jgi:hypothetical protein